MSDDSWWLSDDHAFVGSVALMRKYRLDQKAESDLRQFRSRRSNFNRKLRRTWGPALDAYIRAVTYASQLGADLSIELQTELTAEKPNLVNIMIRLHPSACLVAFETWELLAAGYAQGAFARWRTLHEIAVTALFIEEHGEDVALRYWMHGGIERKRLLKEHDDAGLDPIAHQVVEEIHTDQESLKARWGTSFGGPYGWAADALGKKEPRFRDIEASVGVLPIDTRWTYKWASLAVHPQVWGITVNLGFPGQFYGSLAGPSIFGLDMPANAALISLLQCTTALALLRLEDEWAIRLIR